MNLTALSIRFCSTCSSRIRSPETVGRSAEMTTSASTINWIREPRGMLVVITHEVRLFERGIADHADRWDMKRTIAIKLPADTRSGYIHPRVFLLQRRA